MRCGLSHLLLFRGDGLVNWIGLLVVVQNIFTSLFNSHIFDFHEGWMYVLGVGVAGGMVLKARAARSDRGDRANSVNHDGWHARAGWAISSLATGIVPDIALLTGQLNDAFLASDLAQLPDRPA